MDLFDDLRVAKRIYFGERLNMDLIADMSISQPVQRRGRQSVVYQCGPGYTAYDARQFQFALKINW